MQAKFDACVGIGRGVALAARDDAGEGECQGARRIFVFMIVPLVNAVVFVDEYLGLGRVGAGGAGCEGVGGVHDGVRTLVG